MELFTRIARPLMSGIFVVSGVEGLRDPEPLVPRADQVVQPMVKRFGIEMPTATAVRVNSAAQVAGGLGLAIGRFRRLSALLLAGSLVPTTAAGHRFWEEKEPEDRMVQRVHFLKNVAILGGLLYVASVQPPSKTRAKIRAAKDDARDARKAPKKTKTSTPSKLALAMTATAAAKEKIAKKAA